MSICPKCGASLPDGAKFCSSCGSRTASSASAGAGGRPVSGRGGDAFRDSRGYRSDEYNAFGGGRHPDPSGRSFGSRPDPYRQDRGRRSYDPDDPFGTAHKSASRGYAPRGYDSGSAFGSPYGDAYRGYGRSDGRKGKIILFSCIGAAVLTGVIILLVVLLGGGGPGSSPQATVKSFIKATSSLNIDAMNKCVVPEQNMDESAKSEINAVKSMIKEFKITASDIQDPIYNPEKTECDITATLNMTISADSSLGLPSMPGTSSTGTFHLKKVDGKWLISDMSGMDYLF